MDSLNTANWSLIPEYMHSGMRRWIERGIVPGHFLTAVLTNDLREAVARADDTNRSLLANYIIFLSSYAPIGCWGSPENVKEWNRSGGFEGLEEVA